MHKNVTISRDVEATMIPAGTPIAIPAGTEVTITQALGGTYTVMGPGIMARIEAKNADALGFEKAVAPERKEASGPVNVDEVWDALKTCYDPEIPVNIYDLGLIYDVSVLPINNVQVVMTLTAPSCPAAQTLPHEVDQKIREIEGVNDVHVEVTWTPAWTKDLMSEVAKFELGFL